MGRSPLRFDIETPDDLLVWADIWEDFGEPDYAEACRLLRSRGRWPLKRSGRWLWSVRFYAKECDSTGNLVGNGWGLPHGIGSDASRSYATVTFAFIDLLNHMVRFREEQRAVPPSV